MNELPDEKLKIHVLIKLSELQKKKIQKNLLMKFKNNKTPKIKTIVDQNEKS